MGNMNTAEEAIDWTQSPVVKYAAERCGYPNCELADLLASIIEIKDLEEEMLGRLGVTFTELVERALHAQATDSTARTVEWAVDTGLDKATASRIFRTPLTGERPNPPAVTISELHARGWGARRIATAAGCSAWKVYETLHRLGLTPNNEQDQKKMRDNQVGVYLDAGYSRLEIAQMLGIKKSTVHGIAQRRSKAAA
jgi:hypothetical protein